jgi:ABC-2 type transport system ATP-binding protein
MMEPIIEIRNLSKSFGAIPALRHISLVIWPGTLTVIAGPDGSGKSTLLKCALGLVGSDAGEIIFKGQSVGKDFRKLRALSAYMSERFSLYPDLTVEENLDFYAAIQGVPKAQQKEMKGQLLARTGLEPFRRRLASALSGGLKQKLALAAALVSSPEILWLDEPTTGIDPVSRLEFFEIIESFKKEGRTIILTTPYLDEAERGDEVIFFQAGKIIKKGSIAEMKSQFPCRVFRLEPEGNIFDAYQDLARLSGTANIFIRGRALKIFLEKGEEFKWPERFASLQEEKPRLEDIYFYYEKLSHEEPSPKKF